MDKYVTPSELLIILGFSERTFKRYKKAGVFVPEVRGKYDLAQNIQSYINHIRKGASEEAELDYNRENALLTKAKRELAELELEREREEVIGINEVQKHAALVITTIKTKILGVPSRVAPQLLGQDNIAKVADIIYNILWDALDELSRLTPEEAEKYCNENTA